MSKTPNLSNNDKDLVQAHQVQSETGHKSNSSKKILACGFVVALIAFACVNLLAIGALYERGTGLTKEALCNLSEESSQEGSWSFWVARNYLMKDQAPQVMLFGSSLIGSATFSADTETMKKYRDCVVDRRAVTLERDLRLRLGANTEVFNASIPGSMASDAYLISSALFKPDNKPQLVIIGVNPRDFIDNTLLAPADTEPFHFFCRYVDMGSHLSRAAFGDFFSYIDWTSRRYLPLKRLNDKVNEIALQISHLGQSSNAPARTLVSHLHKKRTVLQVFLGGGNSIRKGEWLINYPMPIGFQDNTREYMNRYKNPNTALYTREKKFFSAFLSKLQNENIKVLVISMPSTIANRALLPETFRYKFKSYLSDACTEYGADFLDLSDDNRFARMDYLDTVHLNAKGGARLSKFIAARVGTSPSLSAAAIPHCLPAELRDNVQTSSTNSVWR